MTIHAGDFDRIVVLTGAGISAESGLNTFRDNGGLWEGHHVEDVATPDAFTRSPELVYKFYNLRRKQLLTSAKPNIAHQALALFSRQFSGKFTLITQNVDDLHERGGSHDVLHMHGDLLSARCIATQQVFKADGDITSETRCPCCNENGNLRPNIVWFGEIPMHMTQIEAALLACDLFVSIGTSGQVYPAAGFVRLAKHAGAATVELNLEPSDGYSCFDHANYGPATDIVPQFFSLSQ
ncbi:MAG: NAD-dependent deacylase [Agarilytica sp.]